MSETLLLHHLQLNSLARAGAGGVATVTMTDIKYEAAFANWLKTATLSCTTPVVVAFDDPSHLWFRSRSVLAINMAQLRPKNYTTQRASLLAKTLIPKLLLDAGLRVVFSEMDVFWKRNPVQLLENRSVDLQVSGHSWQPEVNYGFWIAQPTTPMRLALSRLLTYVLSSHYVDCHDQKVFDFAVRGTYLDSHGRLDHTRLCFAHDWHHLPCNCNRIRRENTSLRTMVNLLRPARSRMPLRWEYIALGAVTHHPVPQNASRTAVAAHIWTQVGSPRARIHEAQRSGFWARDADFEGGCNASAEGTTGLAELRGRRN